MIGARAGQGARDITYVRALSSSLSLSLSPFFSFEASVYQGGIDASIISVDSGSEITVPLIPVAFIWRRSRSTRVARARERVRPTYERRRKKTYFYLNYR